jgi:nucleoside-diphosphate-sugar epimerase
VRLRIGMLISSDPLTMSLVAAAKYGVPVIIGARTAWTAAIHPTDAAAGAVAALRAPSGVYNVSAPPVRKQQLGEALAAAAGVRRPHALPRWLAARMTLAETMSRSQRVISHRLTEATGWRPERPVPGSTWFEA